MISKEVMLKDRQGIVDLNCPVVQFPHNPVLTANEVNQVWQDPGLQVTTVHNADIALHGGDTVMLFRSHLSCGMSVLGVARSSNGVDGRRVEPEPAIAPATEEDAFATGTDARALIENESGGAEDPRITKIGDTDYITYSAYHATVKNRVRVSLATTRDFSHFIRFGPVLERDMRNVVVLPEPISGRYPGLLRPNDTTSCEVGGTHTQLEKFGSEEITAKKFHRFLIPEGCLWDDTNLEQRLNDALAQITKANPRR